MKNFNKEFNRCRDGDMSEELGAMMIKIARDNVKIMMPERYYNSCYEIIVSEVTEHLLTVFNIVKVWEVANARALFITSARNLLRNMITRRFSADRTQDCYGKQVLIRNKQRVEFTELKDD